MTPRPCQWCGTQYESPHPAKLYCSAKCKNDFGNFMAVVGKRIAATAMAWRIKRGGAGVGANCLKDLCALLDEANEEFRTIRPKNAPRIGEYIAARNKAGSHIRFGKDRH